MSQKEKEARKKWYEGLESQDYKAVCVKDEKHVRPLKKWMDKFGFSGRLDLSELVELKGKIRQKTKGNPKKEDKYGLSSVEEWIKVPQAR